MIHYCCHPSCPGYPYRASEKSHPVESCGTDGSPMSGEWCRSDRPEAHPAVDNLILRALDALLRERSASLPRESPHCERMTRLITEIKGAMS